MRDAILWRVIWKEYRLQRAFWLVIAGTAVALQVLVLVAAGLSSPSGHPTYVLFTIALGSYFYIRSGFGAGPRDSLMVALKRKTGLPIGMCRGAIEFIAVTVGWALGGPVGLGTVIAAFGISACVQVVFALMRFEATSVIHETLDATFRQVRAFSRAR